jgi:hypothetical protein
MAAVVNVLRFKDAVDPALFAAAQDELVPMMKAIDGFHAFHVVHSAETEVVLVILGDTLETLDRVATEVGSPWMREYVVPLLSGPPERYVGPVIATSSD